MLAYSIRNYPSFVRWGILQQPEILTENGEQLLVLINQSIYHQRDYLITYLLRVSDLKSLGEGSKVGTPIHYCLKRYINDPAIVKKMLSMGADSNLLDFDRRTPLHLVFASFGRSPLKLKQVADLLLKNGCNPNLRDASGSTALLYAIKRGDKLAVKYACLWNEYVRRNKVYSLKTFDLNIGELKTGLTPFHLACIGPSLSIIVDLSSDSRCNPLLLDKEGKEASVKVPAQFLTSRKASLYHERSYLRKNYRRRVSNHPTKPKH